MPHLFDTIYWEEGDSAGVVDMRLKPNPKPVSELKFFVDYTSIVIRCSIPAATFRLDIYPGFGFSKDYPLFLWDLRYLVCE
jgi:hypothetical protein